MSEQSYVEKVRTIHAKLVNTRNSSINVNEICDELTILTKQSYSPPRTKPNVRIVLPILIEGWKVSQNNARNNSYICHFLSIFLKREFIEELDFDIVHGESNQVRNDHHQNQKDKTWQSVGKNNKNKDKYNNEKRKGLKKKFDQNKHVKSDIKHKNEKIQQCTELTKSCNDATNPTSCTTNPLFDKYIEKKEHIGECAE